MTTLTFSIYRPIIRKIKILAILNCQAKTKKTLSFFGDVGRETLGGKNESTISIRLLYFQMERVELLHRCYSCDWYISSWKGWSCCIAVTHATGIFLNGKGTAFHRCYSCDWYISRWKGQSCCIVVTHASGIFLNGKGRAVASLLPMRLVYFQIERVELLHRCYPCKWYISRWKGQSCCIVVTHASDIFLDEKGRAVASLLPIRVPF